LAICRTKGCGGVYQNSLDQFLRSIHDSQFRDDLLWRRLPRPPGVFQISGDTSEDRFPSIFCFVRDALEQRTSPRLLSFGCSTGDEVFTLRRYMKLAAIDGIDVNPYRIRACRNRLRAQGGDARMSFSVAGSTNHLPDTSYDAIFCMGVLRHGELQEGPAPRCDHLIPFSSVARAVEDFARCLKPGGLLALAHSNFRFADMAIAASFDVAMRAGPDGPLPATPHYGPDNRLLPDAVYRDVVFRKHAIRS